MYPSRRSHHILPERRPGVFWRDPEPSHGEPIEIPDPQLVWGAYYSPFVEAYRAFVQPSAAMPDERAPVSIARLDLSIGLHPAIASLLLAANWQRARSVARELRSEFISTGYLPDGLLVKAGTS